MLFDDELCKVVNCTKNTYDIYIGRPGKWGNPFSHKTGTKAKFLAESREKSIELFKEWILNGEGQYLLKDIHELKGKTLGCWCKPKACHGDFLAKLANNGIETDF